MPSKKPRTTLPAFTPVPRLKDRANGWKPEVQQAFIEALADTGSVRAACRRVGRSECGAYQMRRHPEAAQFREAWTAALDLGIRRIEDIAMDRAIHGTEEPVYSYGKLVGTRIKHNDRLLMFMLRNRAPERFATGGPARSLTALDREALEKHRKRWRKEWEAEQEANAASPADVRKSIERKVAQLKQQVIARTSPRAFEYELAARAQMRADEAAGWRPGFPYAEFADRAAELLPEMIAKVRAEYPPHDEVQWSDTDRRTMGCPPLLPPPRIMGKGEEARGRIVAAVKGRAGN